MIGFALGYVLGTRAGQEGYQEMVDAVKSITTSGELRELAGGVVSLIGDVLKQSTSALGDGAESKLRRIA
jgi:hypothetical protein